jgi:hypothetical protein
MVSNFDISQSIEVVAPRISLSAVADGVAKALSFARVDGTSAFVSTAVTYPNGTASVVRIDEDDSGYFVSDDGYGALSADLMGAMPTFNKVAAAAAQRWGVQFDHRSFFVLHVQRDQLPAAVAAIANTSVSAVERTIYALDAIKVKRTREVFVARISEAFGSRAHFDAEVRGATRPWQIDAVVENKMGIAAVFEFVSPAFSAVASTNMKLGDIKGLASAPYAVAALADYQKTEPSFRSILSSAADLVIAANDDILQYKRAG